jgi:DNA modification methylase
VTIRLLTGDARDVLPTLPDASVQCVVTSPPYYGLRDYGTARWEGGDAGCSHSAAVNTDRVNREAKNAVRDDASGVYAHPSGWRGGGRNAEVRQCKCGARRIDAQLGLEPTPDAYIAAMVGVFREVRRVLRDDGTCWVNMGDSYASSGSSGLNVATPSATFHGGKADARERGAKVVPAGLKPKDLLLMPARLALALQADGWWVRSDIIWAKPNPMPESCTDRPTSAHEHVFLLTKRARYFYDGDAVREPHDAPSIGNRMDHFSRREQAKKDRPDAMTRSSYAIAAGGLVYNPAGRNLRNVWNIATHPYIHAHFATFPPELAERCIKAGTSERGCCAACGAPWVRTTSRNAEQPSVKLSELDRYGTGEAGVHRKIGSQYQKWLEANPMTTTGWAPSCQCYADIPVEIAARAIKAGTSEQGACAKCGAPWVRQTSSSLYSSTYGDSRRADVPGSNKSKGKADEFDHGRFTERMRKESTTTGWAPSCRCRSDACDAPFQVEPCIVLDPFSGAGTALLVADRLGRDAIGIDLSHAYVEMTRERLTADCPLFMAFEPSPPPAEDPDDMRMADLFAIAAD